MTDPIILRGSDRWIKDDERTNCMNCNSVFNLVERKHHCRNCGDIFCAKCTSKRYLGHRMCVKCYESIGPGKYPQTFVPRKQGWLYKQGLVRKGLKKRYFVIGMSLMVYFKDEKRANEFLKDLNASKYIVPAILYYGKGAVYLSGAKLEDSNLDDPLRSFAVKTKNRKWQFRCDNENEVEDWKTAITEEMKKKPELNKEDLKQINEHERHGEIQEGMGEVLSTMIKQVTKPTKGPKGDKKDKRTALICVDLQNDFCSPSGALYVPGGVDAEIEAVNSVMDNFSDKFSLIVFTKDWHPKDHVAFHDNHSKDPKAELFQPYQLPDGTSQMLWPKHCLQNSSGAELVSSLRVPKSAVFVPKGANKFFDSYSGFFDRLRREPTELEGVLKKNNVDTVFICGVALDYCVGFTALDAAGLGFRTYVIEDASKGVAQETVDDIKRVFSQAAITVIQTKELAKLL